MTHTHTHDGSGLVAIPAPSRGAARSPRAVVAPTHLATRSRARRDDDALAAREATAADARRRAARSTTETRDRARRGAARRRDEVRINSAASSRDARGESRKRAWTRGGRFEAREEMSQAGTSTKAGRGADGRERFVVIRAMGLSVDGKVEAVVESEAFPTLEAAIGHSEYLAQTVRARGGVRGNVGRNGGKKGMKASRTTICELPVDTQVWHVTPTNIPGPAYRNEGQLMVTLLSSLCGRVVSKSRNGVLDESEFAYNNGHGVRSARNGGDAEAPQIADGIPYVKAKIFGQKTADPFMLRPNISKAAFRTLLLRAVGKYLADDREPYPVLAKSDVQLQVAQVAHGVQYHVLAIRALGHSAADFSMSIDDQGRTFVRADPAQPPNSNPKLGRPFELLCQFPSLVHLQTCRCIYQDDVLYIIVYPRNAKSRSLRLSSAEIRNTSLPESIRNTATGAGVEKANGPSFPREVGIEDGTNSARPGDEIALATLGGAFGKNEDDSDSDNTDDFSNDEAEEPRAKTAAPEVDEKTIDLPDEDVDSEVEEPMPE